MTNATVHPRHKDEAAHIWHIMGDTEGKELIAQTLANLEAARADLAEIDRIARTYRWECYGKASAERTVAAIAAPYRAKVDPVAEALEADTSPFNAEERMREPFKAFLEAAADCGEHGYLVSMRPDPHGDEWEQQLFILPAVSIVTPAALAKFRAFIEGDR